MMARGSQQTVAAARDLPGLGVAAGARTLLAALTALACSCASTGSPVSASPDDDDVADALAGIGHPGGSDEWDAQVSQILLAAYERDRNGVIDTQAEVDAVPCLVWSTLNDAIRKGTESDLARVYGLAPDRAWAASQLGFGRAARRRIHERVVACPRSAARRDQRDNVAAAVVALPQRGGSDTWDEAVRPLMLAAYDGDHSGAIDTVSEVEAIPCATWFALDGAIRERDDMPLVHLYGFTQGLSWVGDALGFAEVVRSVSVDATTACGMRSD